MKRKRLFVMSGPSGCGKSSWIQKQIAIHGGNWISRDLLRLSLVEENESYFSHEDQVLREFYKEINNKLSSDYFHSDVYVDATHLTPKARRELFRNINLKNAAEVIGVSFEIPTDVAVERNKNRVGRADVPMTVIRDMNKRFIAPSLYEGYDTIIHINEFGEERKEVKTDGKDFCDF